MSITFGVEFRDSDITGWTVTCADQGPQFGRQVDTYAQGQAQLIIHNNLCTTELCRTYRGELRPVMSTEDEPEVNMCNRNAGMILRALGLDPELDYCGSMDADEFEGRLLLADALTPVDAGMPSYDDTRPGGARWIEGARPAGYTQQRLGELHEVVAAARAAARQVVWS